MPAPSLSTKPSRSLSNGRLARGRVVVPLGEGAAGDEPAQAHRRDRRLAAAGDHHVGVAVADRRSASPMAWAADEQAVVTVVFGPRRP